MDYTVQKAVELGVTRIIPVLTKRTVVNLKGDRQQRRREHWQAVANSACEQCGRNIVPHIEPVVSLSDWFDQPANGKKFVLHHRAEAGLEKSECSENTIFLLIGPEGGLTIEEIMAAQSTGYSPLRLGPRIMRTETAAVTALSILQWVWGDLKEQ